MSDPINRLPPFETIAPRTILHEQTVVLTVAQVLNLILMTWAVPEEKTASSKNVLDRWGFNPALRWPNTFEEVQEKFFKSEEGRLSNYLLTPLPEGIKVFLGNQEFTGSDNRTNKIVLCDQNPKLEKIAINSNDISGEKDLSDKESRHVDAFIQLFLEGYGIWDQVKRMMDRDRQAYEEHELVQWKNLESAVQQLRLWLLEGRLIAYGRVANIDTRSFQSATHDQIPATAFFNSRTTFIHFSDVDWWVSQGYDDPFLRRDASEQSWGDVKFFRREVFQILNLDDEIKVEVSSKTPSPIVLNKPGPRPELMNYLAKALVRDFAGRVEALRGEKFVTLSSQYGPETASLRKPDTRLSYDTIRRARQEALVILENSGKTPNTDK